MAAPADTGEPMPISALQHAVYCLRQAALIHLERVWADNRFTAEGDVLHAVADKGGKRKARGFRRVMALPVASGRLNIAGVADMVEFQLAADGGETAFPVEYKRGKAKLHRADEVQLCAQALCLEEMTGRPVSEGALFYGETRRRVELSDHTVDEVRGLEGEAADLYFSVFDHLIRAPDPVICWRGRSRRPPLDPVNALLSFLYTLLAHDCRSALETVGLDFGQRVQYSVFEIEVDPAQWTKLKARLEGIIKPEMDSLRYYYLGANWQRRVEHVGVKPAVDLNSPLMI